MANLKRTLSLPLVTFYGLGSILGAGIYVLLGVVGGVAGNFLPWAFLCATIIAGFTAFSYAELVARMPRSAGEAVYVDAAFSKPLITRAIGYGGAFVGVISAATITSGFVGYFQLFVEVEQTVVIASVVAVLGSIAIIGIGVSAWAATAMTVVEIVGLLLIIVSAGPKVVAWSTADLAHLIPHQVHDWQVIWVGAFLAFYAFLGFEDMINVAEEVHEPERNMPRAIAAALILSSLLYLLVSFAGLASVPVSELAGSETPLSTIAASNGVSTRFMALIALLAISNGALVQIIKSSRILYGMAAQHTAPAMFALVAPQTQTPVIATVAVIAGVLLLALSLPTVDLAALTSSVTLVIFAVVNIALIRIKRRQPQVETFQVPIWVPAAGAVLCLGLLAVQLVTDG